MKHVKDNSVNKALVDGLPAGVERALLRILSFHVGEEKAIRKPDLMGDLAVMGFRMNDDRGVRALINELRKRGHLICSKGGIGGGYWIALNRAEMEEFLEREVHSRAMDLLEQEKALRQAMNEKWGEGHQGLMM